MTEKELHKLKPKDLVMLLLQQTSEILQLYERVEQKHAELKTATEENDNLKEALNESDARIEELKKKLDDIDFNIRSLTIEKDLMIKDQEIPLEKTGSLIDAARKLSDIFVTAQQEANRYLHEEAIPPGEVKHREKNIVRIPRQERPLPAEKKPEPEKANILIPGMEPFLSGLTRDGVLQLEPDDSRQPSMLEELKKAKKSQSTKQDIE